MEAQLTRKAGATLRLSHFYAAPPVAVFEAWTNTEALMRWWCPSGWRPGTMEVDLRKGGRYRLTMRDDGGRQIAAVGQFQAISRPSLLVYTWRWEGAFEHVPLTTVEVSFRSVPGGTQLELAQGPLELPDCCMHLHGWMDALERVVDVVGQSRPHPDGRTVAVAGRTVS